MVGDGVIRHFLDDTLVEEPMGVDDFTEELARDVKRRLIGTKYKATLTFVFSGCEYLQAKYNELGFCGIVSYRAIQTCGGIDYPCIRGEINLAECKFNETKCEVEIAVADDGIGARVVNNEDIPVSPGADKTKNGDDITPVSALVVECFRPNGSYGPVVNAGYDWYDCFVHAVGYITDNAVSVVSSWYPSLPQDERYLLVTGYALRTEATPAASAPLVYEFKLLFTELAKKYNLWIGVERDTSGNPVLRLEPESYFYSDTGTLLQTDIQDLVRATDLDRLWAKVKVGSEVFIKEQATAFPLPFLVLRGFTSEEFHFSGTCNTNQSLDLVNKWVIDTNVIDDILSNNNEEYDDDIFIIQYDHVTLQATQGMYLDPGNAPYLYNEQLQNGLVIARYDLPSSAGAFYGNLDTSFQASRTAPGAPEFFDLPAGTSSFQINQFDNDYTAPNFDTSNSWGNGTAQGNPVSQANSRYTAQAQGFYVFDVSVLWRIVKNVPVVFDPAPNRAYKSIRPQVQVERYDAGNTLIGAPVTLAFTTEYTPGQYAATGSVGLSLNVGDYVQVVYEFVHTGPLIQTPFAGPLPSPFEPSGVTVRMDNGSVIRTSFVAEGGYVAGGGQARVITYEYERHIDLATWVNLTGDPKQEIGIGGGPQAMHRTHVLNADRNVKTGATTWKVCKRP